MLRVALLLSVVLALCVQWSSAQNYEFCYTLTGGTSATTGGYAVWAHGYFWTTGSGNVLTITNTAITRNVLNAVGQRHTEQLAGIVPTNNRVDQLLTTAPAAGNGFVDGSGIQIPLNGSSDTVNGVGTMLGYDQSQPFVFVSNQAYQLTSQLNENINLLYTGTNYGERLDAGGNTISVSQSWFFLQPYSVSAPITNCSVTVNGPLCANSPATPPAGSVLFNITLNTAWTSLPATYVADLLTSLTVLLAGPSNTQAQFLGLWLFSCYTPLTKTAGAQPQLWIYLNANSASLMGVSLNTAVPAVYSALQSPSTSLNNGYLTAAEQGFIASVACPFIYNGAIVSGISGCTSSSSPSSGQSSSTSAPPSSAVSSSTSSMIAGGSSAGGTPSSTTNSSGGSSGLSHGAIAGIVIGGVVGLVLLLSILFFMVRCMSSSSGKKSTTSDSQPTATMANHKRFENESSQISTASPSADGVEMA